MTRGLLRLLVAVGLTLAIVGPLPRASEPGFFLVGVGLEGWHWLLPLAIPPAAGGIAWLAARATTRARLRRWS